MFIKMKIEMVSYPVDPWWSPCIFHVLAIFHAIWWARMKLLMPVTRLTFPLPNPWYHRTVDKSGAFRESVTGYSLQQSISKRIILVQCIQITRKRVSKDNKWILQTCKKYSKHSSPLFPFFPPSYDSPKFSIIKLRTNCRDRYLNAIWFIVLLVLMCFSL